MPVMIPGSASGSTKRNEMASFPKKRRRLSASPAVSPSTSAIAVAASAASSDSFRAACMSGSWIAGENHLVESPAIGQLCTFELLNAYRQMITIGIQRNARTSAVKAPSAIAGGARLHHNASKAPRRLATIR